MGRPSRISFCLCACILERAKTSTDILAKTETAMTAARKTKTTEGEGWGQKEER